MTNIEKLLKWQQEHPEAVKAQCARNLKKGAHKRMEWQKANAHKLKEYLVYARSKITHCNTSGMNTPDSQKRAAENRAWYKLPKQTYKAIGLKARGRKSVGMGIEGPSNHLAKTWEIRSPNGIIYRFKNLSWWIKQNIHLFASIDDSLLKTPLRWRVRSGLNGLTCKAEKMCGSYHGWTVVSVIEKQNERNDLLDRKNT